jgi:hypothetical protein
VNCRSAGKTHPVWQQAGNGIGGVPSSWADFLPGRIELHAILYHCPPLYVLSFYKFQAAQVQPVIEGSCAFSIVTSCLDNFLSPDIMKNMYFSTKKNKQLVEANDDKFIFLRDEFPLLYLAMKGNF